MQKVKIMTLFVKQKYEKIIVPLHRGFKINTTELDMEKIRPLEEQLFGGNPAKFIKNI